MSRNKMKVAFMVGELPTTTFINRLAEGLVKADVKVTLFGLIKSRFKAPNGVLHIGAKDGYKEGRYSKLLFFVKFSILFILFRKVEKKKIDHWLRKNGKNHWGEKSVIYPVLWYQPDILHVQWVKAISNFMWAPEMGIKLVVSLRGAHINYSPYTVPGLKEKYYQCFPLVNAFHGVSKAICLESQKFGALPSSCQVVYSGFDLKQFDKRNWSDKPVKKDSIQILSVGRSHWKKGYHFALDAMKMLKEENINFHYSIIGASGDEELLFQKEQLALNAMVTFLDRVPFNKVKELIADADILLLPSVEEGIANVVLEAMFLGTLVITTDCGGMIESVENDKSGIVVPVRNPGAISDAVKSVLSMGYEKRQQMIENAYIEVCTQHSEENMVSNMMNLYRKVKADE